MVSQSITLGGDKATFSSTHQAGFRAFAVFGCDPETEENLLPQHYCDPENCMKSPQNYFYLKQEMDMDTGENRLKIISVKNLCQVVQHLIISSYIL